jgi:hypothetical protein
MNSVWSFGDSMTAPLENDSEYAKWLGRRPKTYCEFIAEHFDFDIKNKGIAGNSNHQIFDDFLINHKDIKAEDIVIFGWSPIMRYRLASYKNDNKSCSWRQIWASSFIPELEIACVDTFVTKEIAEQILLNRYEFRSFYSEEVNRWILFIKEWAELKGVKIVNWSWCNEKFGGDHSINLDITDKKRSDMREESIGLIKDGHYGEVGHKQLAKEIIEFLNK